MLLTLYKYELKKLFCARVNVIAMAGSVLMLLFLAFSSVSEGTPVSREAAGQLNGRQIDGQLLEEMRPAIRYENGWSVMEISAEYEQYAPVMDVLDVLITATGKDIDLTRMSGADLYALRAGEIAQRMEEQGLSEEEKAYWDRLEAEIQ